MKPFKIQATGIVVDLDTTFTSFHDSWESELAERLDRKPTRVQGRFQALATREDGTQFPQILEILELPAKGPKQRARAERAIEAHFSLVKLQAERAQA